MEKPANKLIGGTKNTPDAVPNSFELLRDKLEYFDVKADFFENQTLILNEIIHKVELKGKELMKEEQELTVKFAERAEVKKNLVNILKDLKSQQKAKKKDETLIKINGFYHCPECSHKSKWNNNNLKYHIIAVHQKLKPWKCPDCTTGKRIKTYQLKYFIK